MSPRLRLPLACLLLLAAGCDESVPEPNDAAAGRGAPSWQSVRSTLDEQGVTNTARFLVDTGARAFALRVHAQSGGTGPHCFALQHLMVNGDTTWIGPATAADYGDYCTQCAHRVSVGSGYGFFILPSAVAQEARLTSVDARFALRDCATLTPASRGSLLELSVELSAWQLPAAGAALRLPVSVVVATQHGFASDSELLPAALRAMRQIWGDAGISLELQPSLQLEPPDAIVEYSASDDGAPTRLLQAARAALGGGLLDPRSPIISGMATVTLSWTLTATSRSSWTATASPCRRPTMTTVRPSRSGFTAQRTSTSTSRS